MENNKRPKVLFVLGGPGSGKGTQCENLVNTYKFKHLSAGDLLREEVRRETPLGIEINGFITKGHMVPGETTIKLIRQGMEERGWNKHVFIIDGFPRNFSNQEFWDSIMKDDIDVIGVLFLACSEEIMKTRIMKRGETSGRSDDNEETFRTRIRVYVDETQPIVEHYRKLQKLFEVNAEGSVEEGFNEIRQVIEALHLDRVEELNEIRNYLHESVDPYIKPLISYLMKNKPQKVHAAIKYWVENEGEEIRKRVEKEE
jgi:UMP-CMP kinase family protein